MHVGAASAAPWRFQAYANPPVLHLFGRLFEAMPLRSCRVVMHGHQRYYGHLRSPFQLDPYRTALRLSIPPVEISHVHLILFANSSPVMATYSSFGS
jgi:hypothetical protein